MIFNVTGGGGAALNFKVLAYATEEALLAATPAENTIGIITETPITSWIFSATEPSPAAAGMVWISIGTSSSVEFNALKKNGLQVYPISAKQYVGGAWVDKVAKSYQGGEWVVWLIYLYKAPEEYTELTGGWTRDGFTWGSMGIGTVTKTDGGMTVKGVQGSSYAVVVTAKKIDVSELNTLYIRASGNSTVEVRLTTATNLADYAEGFYAKYTVPILNGLATLSLDGVTGNFYIALVGDLTYTEVYAK